ncbi:MAG: SMC-Scp complex subunit ScpB [Ruminococcaceae bacterium]|nr:SMC-Scp complex subunit ScpB [Oscillospiraceae bacterium]
MSKEMLKLLPAFEAVLFASGEPISIDKFSTVFSASVDDINTVMETLKERLDNGGSGVELIKLENAYQLCTRSEYGEYIRKMADIHRKTPLSQAAFEVLSVVAYNQPVTKSFIEQVRGVDCSSTVTTLIEKGLLEERGRLELPGKPLLYGTTKNFLRCFGISDLSELPPLPHDDNTVQPDLGEQLSAIDVIEEEQQEVQD